MLIIRKEQQEVLSKYMVEQFVNSAVEHLKTTFPTHTEDIADTDLRTLINDEITKAKELNITYKKDVLRYLELILYFGKDFNKRPEYSWAEEILMKEIEGTAKIILIDEYIESHVKEE